MDYIPSVAGFSSMKLPDEVNQINKTEFSKHRGESLKGN
jgi:hypothetical protein